MQGIGNTPLIKLKHLTDSNCADVYVKYEGANPTGSMKDRMALSMIEGAEKRGELKTGENRSRLYQRKYWQFSSDDMLFKRL